LTTEHTNNLNDVIAVLLYACGHQVNIKTQVQPFVVVTLFNAHFRCANPSLTELPCLALSNCTLVSKKEIHRRISRRTKNPSGVSNLWHSETIWGKQHTLT